LGEGQSRPHFRPGSSLQAAAHVVSAHHHAVWWRRAKHPHHYTWGTSASTPPPKSCTAFPTSRGMTVGGCEDARPAATGTAAFNYHNDSWGMAALIYGINEISPQLHTSSSHCGQRPGTAAPAAHRAAPSPPAVAHAFGAAAAVPAWAGRVGARGVTLQVLPERAAGVLLGRSRVIDLLV
jgi:hypothetical protein